VIAALLASYLGVWSWNESATADGYRLYYTTCCTALACSWPPAQRVDVPASACLLGRCRGEFGFTPAGDAPLVMFVVTAYNVAGESATEHGTVELCP